MLRVKGGNLDQTEFLWLLPDYHWLLYFFRFRYLSILLTADHVLVIVETRLRFGTGGHADHAFCVEILFGAIHCVVHDVVIN